MGGQEREKEVGPGVNCFSPKREKRKTKTEDCARGAGGVEWGGYRGGLVKVGF